MLKSEKNSINKEDPTVTGFNIVILSKEEDRMISLHSSMPDGWQIGDCVYSRYKELPFFNELVESRRLHEAEIDQT